MKKVKTIDLKGNEYAKVADRIKEFREDCPNGLIETTPEIKENDVVMFRVRILKDKSNPDSAEATGHSIGKTGTQKAFEKLETIAVGRALSLLGYMASGEVASSEEMEEFLEAKEKKFKDFQDEVEAVKTVEELKKVKEKHEGSGSEYHAVIVSKYKSLTSQA